LSRNGKHREVVDRIDNLDGDPDTVRDVIQMIDRIDPANVEGVEGTARLAGVVVFRYGDSVDHGIRTVDGGAADRTILRGAAAAHDHK